MATATKRLRQPREAADPTSPSAPQDGDLVLAPDSRTAGRHVIRQAPGIVQLSAATPDEALRLARSCAQRNGVDIWQHSEGAGYQSLETYRRQRSHAR
jgi:hypothetical protein